MKNKIEILKKEYYNIIKKSINKRVKFIEISIQNGKSLEYNLKNGYYRIIKKPEYKNKNFYDYYINNNDITCKIYKIIKFSNKKKQSKYIKLNKENFKSLLNEYNKNNKDSLYKCYNKPSYNKKYIFNLFNNRREKDATKLKVYSFNCMFISLIYTYKKNNKKHIKVIKPTKIYDYISE